MQTMSKHNSIIGSKMFSNSLSHYKKFSKYVYIFSNNDTPYDYNQRGLSIVIIY